MCSPVREVAIGLNEPRISAGANGLRSNVSRWLGPPKKSNRITDLTLLGDDCRLLAPRAEMGGTRRLPNNDNAPARIISRRETPSQQCRELPRMVSIA